MLFLRNESDEFFGCDRLEDSLRSHADAGVRSLRDRVLEYVRLFTGGDELDDDQTILVLAIP